jgi:hypothetical protein
MCSKDFKVYKCKSSLIKLNAGVICTSNMVRNLPPYTVYYYSPIPFLAVSSEKQLPS